MENIALNPLLLGALVGLVLVVLNTGVLLWLAMRRPDAQAALERQQQDEAGRQALLSAMGANVQTMERALRQEIAESSRGARQELAQSLATF